MTRENLEALPEPARSRARMFLTDAGPEVLGAVRLVRAKRGETLLRMGETPDRVYLLLSGSARIIDQPNPGADYAFDEVAGMQFFGELEAIAELACVNAAVVAAQDCLLLCMSDVAFLGWLEESPAATRLVLRSAVDRLLLQSCETRRRLFLPARERIVEQLLACAVPGTQEEAYCVRETRRELSEELACSERTVVRALGALQREGLVTLRRGRILLTATQLSGLRALAQTAANEQADR